MGSGSSKTIKSLKKENAELKQKLRDSAFAGDTRKVNFLHFNDCYELEAQNPNEMPCGGATRFMDAVNKARENLSDTITVFSGDFVGPSLSSVVTKGAHIKEALDTLDVQFGCLGNHEFDYGHTNLDRQLHGYTTKKGLTVPGSRVKWIASNMTGKNGEAMAGCSKYETLVRSGVKVGFLGLAENWLKHCKLPAGYATYEDFCEVGERMAKELKEGEEQCDVVVAITHNRLPNDEKLSEAAPSIDLILGGHDHEPAWKLKKRIVKSGDNFKYLSMITLEIASNGEKKLTCEVDRIDPSDPEDPQMGKLVQKYVDYRDSRMKRILGKTSVDLDSRESAVRFGECHLGNFIADAVAAELGAICLVHGMEQRLAGVVVAGAVIKGGQVLEAGNNVTLGDLFRWSPVEENFEVLEVTGQQLVDFLEKSVKALSLDGTAECASYPHCSFGIHFTVNVAAPAGSRVSEVLIHKEPLDLNAKYAIGVSPFVGSGKVIDSINPGTTRLVDHDDGVGIIKSLKAWMARLRDDDDDDDDDDGDLDAADPVKVDLGRVKLLKEKA